MNGNRKKKRLFSLRPTLRRGTASLPVGFSVVNLRVQFKGRWLEGVGLPGAIEYVVEVDDFGMQVFFIVGIRDGCEDKSSR